MTKSKKIILGLAAALVLMQLVPLDRSNPPVVKAFDGPAEVQDILARSCFDCHSHLTTWPWYSHVAPISYLVVHDVKEGREKLNFSNWKGGPKITGEILDEVGEGGMPLPIYLPMHPKAKLTGADLNVLQRYFGPSQPNEAAEAKEAKEAHGQD